jgi:carbon-monoxide dehydrogenase medium subunit
MYNFDYSKARSVADASSKLKATADSKLLAGGMTLLPTIKLRLAKPAALVDLGTIADLEGIDVSGNTVTIKAMTRHADVARSEAVAKAIPALASLAGGIGDVQVRYRGTIGGSVANNDPAADYPAACLGLGATIVTSKRELAADGFFQGLFTTALEPDEIITAIRFPVPERAAYMKFKNPASRYAIVGVMVSKGPQGVRVAVTGAGDNGVFRVKAMEDALAKSFKPDAVANIKVPADGMLSDIHASAEYRAHLVTVMAKRAVAACA